MQNILENKIKYKEIVELVKDAKYMIGAKAMDSLGKRFTFNYVDSILYDLNKDKYSNLEFFTRIGIECLKGEIKNDSTLDDVLTPILKYFVRVRTSVLYLHPNDKEAI